MKIVINECYGGYGLSNWALKELGIEYAEDIARTDPRLIYLVEYDAESTSGRYAELEVVEIPDNATDWEINEYDGLETITYVVDGKLYHT